MNTAERRKLGYLGISTLVYLAGVFLAVRAGDPGTPAPLRWLLAVLPVLPCVYGLAVLTRHVAAMDELKRLIHLQAAAFALALTVVASLTAASLHAFAGMESPGLIWAVPLIAAGWMIGLALGTRRYA
jgi:hypothetical protein